MKDKLTIVLITFLILSLITLSIYVITNKESFLSEIPEILMDNPDITSRITLTPSPQIHQGHPSICSMTNGTYAMVYGHGNGIYITLSNNLTNFSNGQHKINSFRQPDIACFNHSLWITLSNRISGTIELWNCSENKDVTNSSNWMKVSTLIHHENISNVFNGDPIDSSLYMFDSKVNGHQFWVECLDRNGTSEDNDEHRYIFYSDEPTTNNWSIGNNGEPVLTTMIADKGNWPVDALYVPEAQSWIIFNNQNGNNSKPDIYYAYTSDINTTWTTTWHKLIPNNTSNYNGVLEPDVIRIGDTIYVYYSYILGETDMIAGITTFNIHGFFIPRITNLFIVSVLYIITIIALIIICTREVK